MKRSLRSLLSLSAVLCSILLSSCLGDGTNKYSGSGRFTIMQEGASYTLYNDYGGAVRLSQSSMQEFLSALKEVAKKTELKDGDRFILYYSYEDNNLQNVPGKGMMITEAELSYWQLIPAGKLMLKADAEAGKLLVPDSVFSMKPLGQTYSNITVGAYRGFLTAQFTAPFSVLEDEKKNSYGVYPSLYVIMDPEENKIPNTLNLRLSYNRHSPKEGIKDTKYDTFCYSYPLSGLSSFIPGSDSITVNVECADLKSPLKLRIGRADLYPRDFLYFPN